MMIRHAFTGQTYELVAPGEVKVTDPETGAEGIFDAQGEWRSGAIRNADFHMLRHIGGHHSEMQGMFGR